MARENPLTQHRALTQRIAAFDGLRGFAIVLVVLFHAYGRHVEYTPWAYWVDFVLVRFGFMGVFLFFLISGFVIFMSLDNSKGFIEFFFKRWIRLFPAMLIASILVWFSASLYYRPDMVIHAVDLLPGLLFLEPQLLNKLFRISSFSLEGSFWSLYIEIKFYFLFGALYFINRRNALWYLTALFLIGLGYSSLVRAFPAAEVHVISVIVLYQLYLPFFGWFVVGAMTYKAHATGKRTYLLLSALFMPLALIGTSHVDAGAFAFGFAIYLMFVLALTNRLVAAFFGSRFFIFLGFVSYPLYLIHENAVIGLTIEMHQRFPSMPDMLTPVPGIALLVLIAWVIARYLEPATRSAIRTLIRKIMPAKMLGYVSGTHLPQQVSPLSARHAEKGT